MMADLGKPNWVHPNNKASEEWLHLRKRPRAPRIGLLPRAEAFDEDDTHRAVPICDTNSSATEVGNGSVCGVSGSVGAPGVLKLNGQAGQTTADAGAPAGSTATAATSAANRAGDITGQPATTEVIFDYNDGYDSTADMTSEATTTTKNTNSVSSKTMISSFVTVIEGTKDLSLRDQEKQRSPQHAPSSTASEASSEVLDETGGDLVNSEGPVPVPAKCSAQLRKLLHSHSIKKPPAGLAGLNGGCSQEKYADSTSVLTTNSSEAGRSADSVSPNEEAPNEPKRPIYPNLPYSPYSSPASSPRVRRKPLRETTRVNSTIQPDGEYVQLNQYKLEQALGQGSYGIVKLAYNKDDDVQYAMKILSKKKLKRKGGIFGRKLPNRKAPGGAERKPSENPLQKVYREIAIMKKLDHPNVCKLVEVLDDSEDDNLYMVFELLKEGELLVVPTDNPMPEKEVWLSFRDVVHGLEYLHYQKIIHRDLKPSNLLRADSGEVKIADLGVSNEFDGTDALLTNTAGTPAFTPPESISHKPGDDPYSGKAADIWSLGVTLYSLVYGKVPFHDENIVALYNKIRAAELSQPDEPDISPELKDLISRMLIKDPIQRIKLKEIKTHDWVTGYGLYPMATEIDNCRHLVEVTENEVENSVQSVPKLDTLILVKAMIKNHSFSNPFNPSLSNANQGGSIGNAPNPPKARASQVERCNSAPEGYDMYTETRSSSIPRSLIRKGIPPKFVP